MAVSIYGPFIIPREVVGGFPEGIASRMTEQRARESELQITVFAPSYFRTRAFTDCIIRFPLDFLEKPFITGRMDIMIQGKTPSSHSNRQHRYSIDFVIQRYIIICFN